MPIKIVTDSTADLPHEVAHELGISVVPLYVRFGEEVYRDRVDISEDEFYHRLVHDPVHPGTTQPTPHDFAEVYTKLSQDADGIVSIHIASKLSGTFTSAMQAKAMVQDACPVEVIDSLWASMAMGIIVIEAAKSAAAGASLEQIVEQVKGTIPCLNYLGFFDTLKYLHLGGRIGKAKALMGSALSVKPLLTLKDGEFEPVGRVRTRSSGMDRLFNFASEIEGLQDMGIVHTTTPQDAEALADRMSSFFPRERMIMTRLGPVLGTHCGPGIIFVCTRAKAPVRVEPSATGSAEATAG